jgi:hypothetical protein
VQNEFGNQEHNLHVFLLYKINPITTPLGLTMAELLNTIENRTTSAPTPRCSTPRLTKTLIWWGRWDTAVCLGDPGTFKSWEKNWTKQNFPRNLIVLMRTLFAAIF